MKRDETGVLILKSILKVSSMLIVVSVFFKLLGFNVFGLDLKNEILISVCDFLEKTKLNFGINVILLILEIYIILRLSCTSKNKRIYYILALLGGLINFGVQYLIFEKIGYTFYPVFCVVLFVILATIIEKKINIKKPLIIAGIIVLYQAMTLFLRNITIDDKYEILYDFLLIFDEIVLLLSTYYIFLKRNCELKWNYFLDFPVWELVKQASAINSKSPSDILKEKKKLWVEAPKEEKAYFIIYLMLIFMSELVNLTIIFFVAFLNHSIIECMFIFTSFMITKKVFGKPFHFDSAVKCWIVSNLTYYLLNKISLPITLSFVVPITLGVLLSYVMSRFVKEKSKQLYRGIYEQELLEICDNKNLTGHEINILKDFYCDRMSLVKMGFKYNYTEPAIRKQKKKALEKINTK